MEKERIGEEVMDFNRFYARRLFGLEDYLVNSFKLEVGILAGVSKFMYYVNGPAILRKGIC